MILGHISDKLIPHSTSFVFFKRSCLYLEEYLRTIFQVEDIELLEKEILEVNGSSISAKQQAYLLTGTMLINRVFTLADSYFETLAYEMGLLSKGNFQYIPYDEEVGKKSTKAIGIKREDHEIIFHRLYLSNKKYIFKYVEEYKELIELYLDTYSEIRNPTTHNASKLTAFLDLLKSLVLSISYIDISFSNSWKNNPEYTDIINILMYEYFIEVTITTLESKQEIMQKIPNIKTLEEYDKIISKVGEMNIKEYEPLYDKLFNFAGGKQFSLLLL